jgi:hemolysin activation/secretion protein
MMITASMTSTLSPRMMRTPMAAALLPVLLAAALPAHAYQAVPNAGTILQQQQPAQPPAPQPGRPALQVEPANAAGMPASRPFPVRAIRIVGNTAFATDILQRLVADAEGTTATLPRVEQLAARITAYYRDHGFPLSRAIVPAQAIADGQVVIQVVEARYGAVRLENSSMVRAPLLAATLSPLRPGQLIAGEPLDRALLLLSDVPGVAVEAVIKPGAEVGAADLVVATREKPATVASVVLDNAGNRYIGRTRVGATVYATNPLHLGDILDASVISTGDGMTYARLGYEALVNGQGTRAGVSYSHIRYDLQGSVAALDADGTAAVASAWIKQPLLRGRQSNLSAQLEYDGKRLRDRIGVTDTRTDRHLGNWVLSLYGDARDELLGGGVNAWSLGWTRGRTRFNDAAAELQDAATAQTRGTFSKWNANGSRLQRLAARDALYLNLGVQWANTNLDSAEKMTVGGPYNVRAYDIGAVSGDSGYTASAEWRHELGHFNSGSMQAIAFIDTARVKLNRNAWTTGENTARLSGAGAALAWTGPDAGRASLSVATPIGAEPALLGKQSSVRAWVTASKAF